MSCLVLQIILTHSDAEDHPASGRGQCKSSWAAAVTGSSAELPNIQILSSAMATLGGQRIPFESVRRLGYCHPMAISFLSFLRFAEISAFSGTSSFEKRASNLAAINALLLAAITDMLHL
jgi:hypothetical protein